MSFMSRKQFKPTICAASRTDLLSASVKKDGTCEDECPLSRQCFQLPHNLTPNSDRGPKHKQTWFPAISDYQSYLFEKIIK